MLTAIEFEQFLGDLRRLEAEGKPESKLAKAVQENLTQIKEVVLRPKTPANKAQLLELIAAGQKLVGSQHEIF
jgi:hypothetical protein